ncbi:MAG: porin family protein [Dysgonamonadaceae bacterium]|jgi:hypothetical protein|nr:porin family protein [Dysgonamonadaceae bacterium]
MKKVILTMFLAVSGLCLVSAQVYLGGSVGFSTSNSKPEKGTKTDQSSFSFIPEVGYSLNQDLDLGLKVGFGNNEYADNTESSNWIVAPYVKYSFAEFGRFSVWGQGELFVGGAENNKVKSSSFGLNIKPVLKYNLSDNFVLVTNLNFLNIGFAQTKTKNLKTDTGFSLGMNTNNVANTGNLSIGFIYKF